jgi:hypothetical protein
MGEFNVLDVVMDEVRFCESINMQVTKIILGIKAFNSVWERKLNTDPNPVLTRNPEPNTYQLFMFDIPLQIVRSGNPWAIGFERKRREQG